MYLEGATLLITGSRGRGAQGLLMYSDLEDWKVENILLMEVRNLIILPNGLSI